MSRHTRGGRAVRDGAGVRGPAPAVRADVGSSGPPPGPAARRPATAFGLARAEAPDRFFVGLAVLSLLSEAADERPLVCLVDDAQWLDRASVETLGFVARRLLGESVALVFAVRDGIALETLTGLPRLHVAGLSPEDAGALLRSVIPGPLDERVADRIVAETRGNPLALLELPRGLSTAQLAGGFGLPDTGPLAGRIEQRFQRRLEELPAAARRLLLIAAAEPVGDPSLVWRAARAARHRRGGGRAGDGRGSRDLGTRVRFRHPLVRSAVYRGAPDRTSAARCTRRWPRRPTPTPTRTGARGTGRRPPPGRTRRWPPSSSAPPGVPRRRGGLAAAAAFLERADGAHALTRRAARDGRSPPRRPRTTPGRATRPPPADHGRAGPARRARPCSCRTPASPDRVDAAGAAAPRRSCSCAPRSGWSRSTPTLARETYFEALGAALTTGHRADARRGRAGAAPPTRAPAGAGRGARDDRPGAHGDRGPRDGHAGPQARARGVPLRAAVRRRRAARARLRLHRRGESVGRRGLASCSRRATSGSRATRARSRVLPIALELHAAALVMSGDFSGAQILLDEADAIARRPAACRSTDAALLLAGWQGDEAHALEPHRGCDRRRLRTRRGEHDHPRRVRRGLAVQRARTLRLRAGRRAALLRAPPARSYPKALVEMAEAAARSDAPAVAADALERLRPRRRPAARTGRSASSCARARCSATAPTPTGSIARRSSGSAARASRPELARAHLLYGEWLRRGRRRRRRPHAPARRARGVRRDGRPSVRGSGRARAARDRRDRAQTRLRDAHAS